MGEIRETLFMRVETVLLTLLCALLLPAIVGQSRSVVVAEGSPRLTSPEALRYARERLWNDFMAQSISGLDPASAGQPSLAEYRAYLSALGLMQPGDVIWLGSLFSSQPGTTGGRLGVGLDRTRGSLVLRVLSGQDPSSTSTIGYLEIRESAEGELACESRTADTGTLWSVWPLTPQPLLP